MRIDAHQHFWQYNPHEYGWIDDSMVSIRRDFLPQDLKPELGRAGFEGSVLVQARQSLEETRWMLDLAERSPWILGVVGWVDLQSADVRSQLEEFRGRRKLVGMRHIVQAEPDEFLLKPEFLRGIAALEQFDLAYDLLINTKHLPIAAEFVGKFPRQRFVLDHMAKPAIKCGAIDAWAEGIRRLAALPNVFAKLSGLVTEADWRAWTPQQLVPYLGIAFESFGPRRLMIGSDWPVCLTAAPYARVMQAVRDYVSEHQAESLDDVLGENAMRFWRLEKG